MPAMVTLIAKLQTRGPVATASEMMIGGGRHEQDRR
jgi:hypothetical protein